jgi:hypothetical protein
MTGASTVSRGTDGRGAERRHPRGLLAAAVPLRYAFAALLLATGVAKLVDLAGFAGVVGAYRLVPETLLFPAALLLAAVEVALGAWLLARWRPVTAALAAALLHLGYLAWLALALARGLAIPNCGCFGVFWPRPLTRLTLVEDGVLLVLALVLLLAVRRGMAATRATAA